MFSLVMQMTPREALTEIYSTNGGETWIGATNWNTVEPICTWAGVSCNGASLIIGLDMSGFGLTGQLADVFASFSFLKSLYMNNELLVSTFPESICTLSNLQYLQANAAGFSGELPTCVCNMHFLQFFYIDNNAFTGGLPVCLGTDMQFLRELHIRCN